MRIKLFSVLVQSCLQFSNNNGMANAAAIAYFAAFSLPSLLLISIALVGFFVEPQDIQGELNRQIGNIVGEDAAEQVQEIVVAAEKPRRNFIASIVGGMMLLFGSTGVLFQMQTALNEVWKVEANPDQNTWLAFFLRRVLSLSMLLVFAFLLLVTISVQAVISKVGPRLDALLPQSLSTGMLVVVNHVVGFVLLSLLLAAMFRFLPDAKVPWRSVWFGALVTTLLFTLGKQVMGWYLAVSNPGAIYGTAGSLAIVLIWVYYASMIVLFGAQLTRTWCDFSGATAQPEEHAIRDPDN